MLYDVVAAVARFGCYPTPSGSHTWEEDDVRGVAHDLLIGRRGLERITGLFMRADDDESLERLIQKTVWNHFRSLARATDRGHLHRRLRDVLEEDDRFEQVLPGKPGAGRWRLAGSEHEPWQGSTDDLVEAAWAVEGLELVRWRADSAKRSPVAHSDALARLMEFVLDEAGGSLDRRTLVEVVSRRFGLALGPMFVSLDEPGEPARPPLDPADPGVEIGPDQVAAEMVWRQLGDEEQGHLAAVTRGTNVREVAALAGIGKSSVASVSERLAAKIRQLLGDAPDERVVDRLMELARTGRDGRTGGSDTASEHRGEDRGTP